jgi:hypothetical protein
LVAITEKIAADGDYRLGAGTTEALTTVFSSAIRNERFGNARLSRNLFEQAINSQALRLTNAGAAGGLDASSVATLEPADFVEASKRMSANSGTNPAVTTTTGRHH